MNVRVGLQGSKKKSYLNEFATPIKCSVFDMVQSLVRYHLFYDSPVGYLGLCIEHDELTKLDWLGKDKLDSLGTSLVEPIATGLRRQFILALDNYFESSLMIDVSLSLRPQGTVFQQRVWQFLRTIPFGSVRTYGDVASELQTGSRAIGQACRSNRIPLFIPCHRVVATHGLGGFVGGYRRVERKRWLLQHEGAI